MSPSIYFFVITFISSILSTFIITTKGNYIKKTFLNIPKAIAKNSMVYLDDNEKINPYFVIEKFNEDLNNYLKLNLKGSINKYYINITSYKYKIIDNKKTYFYEDSKYPKNIQLHLSANYYLNFKVNVYLRFEVEKIK
ncbi:MAG: hypothetical protein ACTTID_02450 [Bacillales bacterium]